MFLLHALKSLYFSLLQLYSCLFRHEDCLTMLILETETRPPHVKTCLAYMRTAKAQISLRIRAVWSGPSLSANRIIGYYKIKYMNGEQRPGWYLAHAQDDLNAHCTWPKALFRMTRPIGSSVEKQTDRIALHILWLKISFSWKNLNKLDKLGIPCLPYMFIYLILYLILLFNKSILPPVNVCKVVGWVANSVDPVLRRLIWVYTVCSSLSEYVE